MVPPTGAAITPAPTVVAISRSAAFRAVAGSSAYFAGFSSASRADINRGEKNTLASAAPLSSNAPRPPRPLAQLM